MTMHAVYLKENQGVIQNPMNDQLPSAAVPWWSGIGSQQAYSESVAQLESLSLEHPTATVPQLTSTKQAGRGLEQGIKKGSTTQFTIFPVDCKTSANMPMQSTASEYRGCFELGFGQPVICAKYPNGDQCYGVFSTYGQIAGRIMLPLNLTMDDGPTYVNAKQYHGIIRRRLSRIKAESENKFPKTRKPYLHLSRHLHAMRRPRGCGGRFLNTKISGGGKGETEDPTAKGQPIQPTESQNSEVLQSDSGNLKSPKEVNGTRSNLTGSEVSSLFSRGDANHLVFNHLHSSVRSISDVMNAGHGMAHAMPSKWIAAADGCCNLKV
ncbi:hypothetical protein NMG60_11008630 [Bertholletia excelsa]